MLWMCAGGGSQGVNGVNIIGVVLKHKYRLLGINPVLLKIKGQNKEKWLISLWVKDGHQKGTLKGVKDGCI